MAAAPPGSEVHPPPFRLPGEHFVAALLWLAAGSVGLTWVAPELAAGNIFDPRVFAVTHSVTLGVITTAIFGALYQLFPVTMGRAVRSVPVAHGTFWFLQGGILLVVAGFWSSAATLLSAGWILIAIAVVVFGANLVSLSLATRPEPLVGRYVCAGYLALVAALSLGGLRVGEGLGHGHVDRLGMIASHFHLAAAGFATLVAVGVGHRMLPMFLVSHGFPRWPFQWSGVLCGAGLGLFVAGQLSQRSGLILIGGGLIAGAGCFYTYLTWQYFRRRVRRALDPGMAHVAVAHLFLLAAMGVGSVLLLRPGQLAPRLWAAYALLLLVGWLVLLIVGILYKILPFLTWLHLFGGRVGEADLPTVADLSRPAWGWISLACLAGGLLLLAPAVALGGAMVARLAAAAVMLGVGLVLGQAGRVLSMRYRR